MTEFVQSNYSFEILSANKSEVHPEETIKFKILFHQIVTNTSPNITRIGFRLRLEDALAFGCAAPYVYIDANISTSETFPLELEFTTYDITTYNVDNGGPVVHNDLYEYSDNYQKRLCIQLIYLESSVDNVSYSNTAHPTEVNSYIYVVISKHTYFSIEPTYQQVIVGSKNCQENSTNQLRVNETWQVNGLFPIGSIHMSMDSTNPSEYFGGIWTPFAKGRVLVCVNSNDNDFNAPLKTGGEKTHQLTISEMPSHTHRNYVKSSSVASGSNADRCLAYNASYSDFYYTSYVGSNTPHNNLQQYKTCYMWLRVG